MTVRNYSSIAEPTTLTASISDVATVIQVAATTGFPGAPFRLALDYGGMAEELVDVTAIAGLSLTVTRGVDGTSIQSHSLGAVVRHVASGGDLQDFQSHIAATGGVHGVAGSVVGTTDTQTLANKTLTAPAVSDGSFTGAPVFNVSSGVQLLRSTSAGVALKAEVIGDAYQRYQVQADGTQLWGPGSATADTNLYRSAANALATDDALSVGGRLTALTGATLVGDPSPSTGGPVLKAGPASVNAAEFQDASGAQVARVDINGVLWTNGLVLLNDPAWTTFQPLWTSTGTQPSIGNGTLTGRYKQIGTTVHMVILCKFGSTTTFGTGTYGWSYPSGRRPAQNAPVELTYGGMARGHGTAWYSGAAVYDLTNDNFRIFSHNGTQEWAPATPVTWTAAATNYINLFVTYETA